MSPIGTSVSPIIMIDRGEAKPLHRQVYDGFREAILRGDLAPGQRIPSSRELAAEIHVSRFPVLQAYSQLLAEGYFESHVGSGTSISSTLPEQMMSSQHHMKHPDEGPSGDRPVARRNLLYPKFREDSILRGWGAFGLHQPAFDQFPFRVWSELVTRHSRNPWSSSLQKVDPMGSPRFREEICQYLRTARSVKCEPDQIMIVSGSQQALDITARVLLDSGDSVLVEEPGYNLEKTLLTAAGCRLTPVPVDDEGMDIAMAPECKGAKAAFVTPSHQFPLGSTMSASRRLHLLNWAHNMGAWIVEDDYDSEYRYDAMPIASLQGLDVNERVIYIGTFSKMLFPSLRIGYVVIPRDLVSLFEAVRFATDIFPPYLNQEALADFMKLGHLGQYIRKMRCIYAERRDVLVESIRAEFGDFLEVLGASGGMHLSVALPAGLNDVEISTRAASEKLILWPLSRYYANNEPRHGFVLGFGSVTAEEIPVATKRMRAAVHDDRAASKPPNDLAIYSLGAAYGSSSAR
jgi:GntR family transcriptional regulator / MocR family aminotransferase